jgi:hypothetical protein
LNPRPHEAQLEDQKAKKSLRKSSRRRKNVKANKKHEKRQSKTNWQRRGKKSSEDQEKLKINTPPEINSP